MNPDLPAEVLLVSLLVLLLKTGHVVGDMKTEDVLSVDISVQLLALGVITWESLLGVRDVNASINGSLQSSKNLQKEMLLYEDLILTLKIRF